MVFSFASDWLTEWREFSKPITKKQNKESRISFGIQLQIALKCWITCYQSNEAFSKLYGAAGHPRYWMAKLHMSDGIL